MGRYGISYDQVAAVADSMVAENIIPTNRNVREKLGTGSCTTIQDCLARWRNERPQPVIVVPELPAIVINALNAEIERVKAEVRVEFETRLVICLEETADLMELGEKLEDELEKRTEELRGVAVERDGLMRTVEELTATISQLNRDVERERHGFDQARIEVAEVRVTVTAQDERIRQLNKTNELLSSENSFVLRSHHDMENAVATLTAKLEAADEKLKAQAEGLTGLNVELDRLKTKAAAETQARYVAERNADVFAAKLEYEQDKSKRLLAENEAHIFRAQMEREPATIRAERAVLAE